MLTMLILLQPPPTDKTELAVTYGAVHLITAVDLLRRHLACRASHHGLSINLESFKRLTRTLAVHAGMDSHELSAGDTGVALTNRAGKATLRRFASVAHELPTIRLSAVDGWFRSELSVVLTISRHELCTKNMLVSDDGERIVVAAAPGWVICSVVEDILPLLLEARITVIALAGVVAFDSDARVNELQTTYTEVEIAYTRLAD